MARKVYVDVVVSHFADGRAYPVSIRWEDGTVYHVDSIISRCKARSYRVGGAGIRYTVKINGHSTFLFDEEGRWFVEAKF